MSDPIQSLFEAISRACQMERARYQLTIGRAVARLGGLCEEVRGIPVKFDVDDLAPGPFVSYRGYYSDLAIVPIAAREDPSMVWRARSGAELREALQSALGKRFTGWKGGDFVMSEDTPLWMARDGELGRAIVGIDVTPNAVLLRTLEVDD